jgi:ferritin-like metal-binding protein YciE
LPCRPPFHARVIPAQDQRVNHIHLLIAAAQRIEHYEIAGYGTAKTLAAQLELRDASDILDETLSEEGKADKLLTKIATGPLFQHGINQEAANR